MSETDFANIGETGGMTGSCTGPLSRASSLRREGVEGLLALPLGREPGESSASTRTRT